MTVQSSSECAQVRSRGSERFDEYCAQFGGFAVKALRGLSRREMAPQECLQPEFGLVGFFDDETELGDKFASGARASSRAVIGADAGCGLNELSCDRVSGRISRQDLDQVDHLESKSFRPRPKIVELPSHG